MSHPIVHAEIRSSDPDATRAFFGSLFGWTYPTEGEFPGYTFVDTGVPDALYTAISPCRGTATWSRSSSACRTWTPPIAWRRCGSEGGSCSNPSRSPGCRSALIADPQGHVVGLAQQLA